LPPTTASRWLSSRFAISSLVGFRYAEAALSHWQGWEARVGFISGQAVRQAVRQLARVHFTQLNPTPLPQVELGATLAGLEAKMEALDADLTARAAEAAQLQARPLIARCNVYGDFLCKTRQPLPAVQVH